MSAFVHQLAELLPSPPVLPPSASQGNSLRFNNFRGQLSSSALETTATRPRNRIQSRTALLRAAMEEMNPLLGALVTEPMPFKRLLMRRSRQFSWSFGNLVDSVSLWSDSELSDMALNTHYELIFLCTSYHATPHSEGSL